MRQIFLFALLCISITAVRSQNFGANIIFYTFSSNGATFNFTLNNNDTMLKNCPVNGNITLIVHGWKESISSGWTSDLIKNFLKARQGCVIFVDYYYFGQNPDFAFLVTQIGGIQGVFTQKLWQLVQLGYNPDNFFVFGFSYGAHVVFEGCYNFGPRRVGRVDACEPAGPYFTDPTKIHAADAGKTGQCVHTSTDLGTPYRYCQKDVLLGNCGITQVSATAPPKMSHGMCPYLYSSAMVNDFKLVHKDVISKVTTYVCTATKTEPDVTKLPPAVMGFRMNMSLPDGQYYTLTTQFYPFN